jgi:RND superfamily putative drug exporter
LVVIALVLVVTSLKGLTSTGAVVGSTQSSHAQVLYNRVLGVASTERPTDVIVLSSAGLNVEDAGFQRFASRLIAQVRTNPGVTNVITDLHARSPFVSSDGHAALIVLRAATDGDIKPVVRAVRAASGQGGVSATVTGDHTADEDFISLSSHDLEHGELGFGLPVALVVLVLVFGAAVAALMPVFMALIAIAVGFGIAAILSHVFTLSVFIVNMMTGMGLALGIDYSLFVISRFREERAAGLDKEAAIQRAGATASRAVLFSGGTFTAALLGLLIVRVNVLRSLAAGAVIVGVVSVAAALTLLPAMLSIIGDRVNSLRLPIVGKHLGSSTAAEARIWTAFITAVPRRPAVSLILVGGIMVLAAAPVFGLHIGQSGVSSLPDNVPSKQGYLAMERYSRPRTPIPSRSRWRADRRSTAQTSRRSRGCSRATTGSDRVSSRPPRTARFWH